LNISNCDSVKFWLNKACGSNLTKKNYRRLFNNFTKHYNLNPDALIQVWKTVRYDWKKRQEFLDEWSEKIEVYVYNRLENLTSMSKTVVIASILSFFKHHKIPLEVTNPKHPYVTYHNRDITREEIKRILQHSSIRNKAFYLTMLESGLRPGTISQLKYRNIKDDFQTRKIPMKIDVPASILKDRVGHRFSFIGKDAFEALKEYLSPRQPLHDDDYVFTKSKRGTSEPVSPVSVSIIFGRLVIKLGLDKTTEIGKPRSIRMYCLRKYFRNNIRVEDTSYREFWMGHTFGTDEHYLTRNVEKHREVYAEAYPSLRLYQPEKMNFEEIKEKLTAEIEAKIRAEYEKKLQEQVKKAVKEEVRKYRHIVPHEVEAEYRRQAENWLYTKKDIREVKPDYIIHIDEDTGKKFIEVHGYWKDGKYSPIAPARIQL